MKRLMKEKVKNLLAGLLVLTIALGPITTTFAQASTLIQNDNSTSISQRLADEEMKEIVGGKRVKRWVKRVFWKDYTVDVVVHTQVRAHTGYTIEGYGTKGYAEEHRYSVTYFYEGEYLAGKYTITGRTFWGVVVRARSVLVNSQREVVRTYPKNQWMS